MASDAAKRWVAPYWRSMYHEGGQAFASVWVLNPSSDSAGVTVEFLDTLGNVRGAQPLFLNPKQTDRAQSPEAPQATFDWWGWVRVTSLNDVPVVPWGETLPSQLEIGSPDMPLQWVEMTFYRAELPTLPLAGFAQDVLKALGVQTPSHPQSTG